MTIVIVTEKSQAGLAAQKQTAEAKTAWVSELSEKTGVPERIVSRAEKKTEPVRYTERQRRAKGWYDKRTGEACMFKWIQDNKGTAIWQKEKVLSIIDRLRTDPADAERIGLNLDSVAKIIENIENPNWMEEDRNLKR